MNMPSTGSATDRFAFAPLHPWLQPCAPSGRECMASICGSDTTPERVVRSVLHRLGCRFALHRNDLPGKPDIVMPARGAIVLVHVCFWHMHSCKRGRSSPVTNAEFWQAKRTKNKERDRKTLAKLRREGWRVLVVWECQTPKVWSLSDRLSAFLLR